MMNNDGSTGTVHVGEGVGPVEHLVDPMGQNEGVKEPRGPTLVDTEPE